MRDYTLGEQVARRMFAPVMNAYRVTVEQMAILEPAMSETVILTCMFVMKEAIDEAVRHGVPAEAAREFALGHMNVNVGILFGYLNTDFSDGAKLAVARAKDQTAAAGLEASVRAGGRSGAGEGDHEGAGERLIELKPGLRNHEDTTTQRSTKYSFSLCPLCLGVFVVNSVGIQEPRHDTDTSPILRQR